MAGIAKELCVFEKRGSKDAPVLSVVSSKEILSTVSYRLESEASLDGLQGVVIFYACSADQFRALVDEISPTSADVLTMMPGDPIAHCNDPAAVLYWTVLAHAADLGIVLPKGVKRPA